MIRDIESKSVGNEQLSKLFLAPLKKAKHIRAQQRHDSNKLYSWHAPEVECISKGKAHKPYEFGCKVSVTTSVNPAPAGHFVLHTAALHGRPYDGHTLNQVIAETTQWIGKESQRIYVDKGYRGHNYPHKFRVFKSGQKRGIPAAIKRQLKRRSVVEPLIGHLKNEGSLGRNYLKGTVGDKINALMVAAGYNFRLILKWLRKILSTILFAYFYRTRVASLLFHQSLNLNPAF